LGLAERVYVMNKGAVQWEGTPEVLRENGDVCKAYLEV
jgi:ABC-type branched-subunit amino acid transport system ATPase component